MADQKWYLGLDVGSAASKCVVVDGDGGVVAKACHPSGAGTPGPETVVSACLDALGASLGEIAASCATGYGRHLSSWTTYEVSELTCHAAGAAALFPGVRTVIDIGGQDAKVLSIDGQGNLANFAMNDKCAAGTGRFLEVMARIFGCDVSELAALDEAALSVAPISSTCTVFAESEVISKLASGTPVADIAAGVDDSVAKRACGLAKRVGVKAPVAMTGGVALNGALRRRIAAELGVDVATCELAQLNGAYGAALVALRRSGGGDE